MINLVTGLPGASKTLWTLSHVKKWAEDDKRPVFYSGINSLNTQILDWTEIEAEKWFDCPPNSIVVIDECQRVFRPRTLTKEVPQYVAELETHRHKGIDLVFITQHPMLVDTAVRRLCGNHRHIVRRFGMNSSTIHQWDSVKENCDKNGSRYDSNKSVFNFDKQAFNYYKSAEVHTVKRSIPKRIFLVLAVPFAVGFAVWYMYNFTHNQTAPVSHSGPGRNTDILPAGLVPSSGDHSANYKNAEDDVKQYVYENTPRVADLPQSAPKYDKITEPTIAPFPAGCIIIHDGCKCYSQQGTPIKTSDDFCRGVVKDGIFKDFDDKPVSRNQVALNSVEIFRDNSDNVVVDTPVSMSGSALPVSVDSSPVRALYHSPVRAR